MQGNFFVCVWGQLYASGHNGIAIAGTKQEMKAQKEAAGGKVSFVIKLKIIVFTFKKGEFARDDFNIAETAWNSTGIVDLEKEKKV